MLRKPLIQDHRRRARLLLYASPLLIAGGVWAITRLAGDLEPDMAWRWRQDAKHEAVGLLRQHLRFDTSFPAGNEIPAAEFLARELEAAGLVAHVERLGERNANLWAILEGEDPRALVLHNHLDVEPVVQPEKWRRPPFSGDVEGPFIYGRGAFDMKSLAIAQLVSVLRLARADETPRRSLIFLATGEEEIDSRLGTRHVLREHPELVERFAVVLTEGGAVEATALDRIKYWGTEFSQKRFVDLWVCDASRERLADLRRRLQAIEETPREPSGAISRFLSSYAPSRDNPVIRKVLNRPESMLEHVDFPSLPPYLKAMVRNEIFAFPIEDDPDGGYRMKVILHLLPDADLEGLLARLEPELFGFTYTVDVPHGPVDPSPLDHEVFREIDRLIADEFPDVSHGPLFLPWVATDARFFRAAGIPAYGFSPFVILSSDTMKMKGPNERMPIPSYVDGVELYYKLVTRLVS